MKDEDKNLRQELDLLKKKTEEYLNGWKRARADYINFKKDTQKRQQELIQFANAALLAELIPIFDHYKLAWQHVPKEEQEKEWVKGFLHIKKQFEDFLKNLGIEEIKTAGEKFNPEFHEAIAETDSKEFEAGIIVEEFQKGYALHGSVLRHARVKISAGKNKQDNIKTNTQNTINGGL